MPLPAQIPFRRAAARLMLLLPFIAATAFGEPSLIPTPAKVTGIDAQRQAQNIVLARLRDLYSATQNARNYGDNGVQLLRHNFDGLRRAYSDFTATLTPKQSSEYTNEWAELGAGLDILQQSFDNYRQDLADGRTTMTALIDLCQVLERGGRIWLQDFNEAARQAQVGK